MKSFKLARTRLLYLMLNDRILKLKVKVNAKN